MADNMGNAIGKVSADAVPRSENELRIPYTELREWLEEAEKLGEVKHVQGANWERDIGMASEVVLHDDTAPCVVFEDVPGTIEGSRVLTNFFSSKRMGMTLGFSSNLSKIELSDAFRANYMEDLKEIPHVIVEDGPVYENIMEGDDVDVEDETGFFPIRDGVVVTEPVPVRGTAYSGSAAAALVVPARSAALEEDDQIFRRP